MVYLPNEFIAMVQLAFFFPYRIVIAVIIIIVSASNPSGK